MEQKQKEILETMQLVIGAMLNPQAEEDRYNYNGKEYALGFVKALREAGYEYGGGPDPLNDMERAIDEASECPPENLVELFDHVLNRYIDAAVEEQLNKAQEKVEERVKEAIRAIESIDVSL